MEKYVTRFVVGIISCNKSSCVPPNALVAIRRNVKTATSACRIQSHDIMIPKKERTESLRRV